VERAKQWGAADLAALRALPATVIAAKPLPGGGVAYKPFLDGKVVLDTPRKLFTAGKQAPVPFLIGANSYEASLMTAAMAGPLAASVWRPENEKQAAAYGPDRKKAMAEIFGDWIFVAPARYLAEQMKNVGRPAYLYHFSYLAEAMRGKVPGAPHGSEIRFVFNNVTLGPQGAQATEAEKKLAALMSGYWVAFARSGNPNGAGRPEWPAYDPATDKLMEFGTEVQVRANFRKEKLGIIDAFQLRLPGMSEAARQ
jgi:para-nitrobenzyl esterase